MKVAVQVVEVARLHSPTPSSPLNLYFCPNTSRTAVHWLRDPSTGGSRYTGHTVSGSSSIASSGRTVTASAATLTAMSATTSAPVGATARSTIP